MWACDPVITNNILSSYHGAGPLFVQTLQSIIAAHCALVGDHVWPPDATDAVLQDPNYDFIVIGSGSAGAVVANRLSEIPNWKVLLVEAGGNPTLATEIPQIFYNNLESPEDWDYKTEPQEGACRSYRSKGCAWPRGKTLGGCSSINGMFYVRGNKIDYDEWEALGNKGWSYEDVLTYFKKSENFSEPLTETNKRYHNTGGYLNVENTKHVHDFEKLVMKAAVELGLKLVDDVNGDNQMGIWRSSSTTKDGIRHSTARAFLSPIRERKNLQVIKNAYATKILFKPDSNVVDRIILNKDGKDISVYVKKELVLSAGAINTPQLLMLSGIGPRKHLENLGIEVKADLPVGENLQDHAFVPVYYKIQGDRGMSSLPIITAALSDFLLHKAGPLADTIPHKVIGFINTTDPTSSSPDIELHHIIFPPSIHNLVDVYDKHDLSDEFHHKFKELNTDNIIIKIYHVLLKPHSKGRVVLNSSDPFDKPLMYANYFDDPEDLQAVIKGMKQYALKLGDTEAFKAFGVELVWVELDACKSYEKNSDEFLECIARELTFSLYHPVGTAKMGPDNDETAVVDSTLKVRNVKGLRVIDASIMPKIVRGNTNAPTIMIGEKGADLIKKDWLDIHTEL